MSCRKEETNNRVYNQNELIYLRDGKRTAIGLRLIPKIAFLWPLSVVKESVEERLISKSFLEALVLKKDK